MKNVAKIIKDDFKLLFSNVISIVVVIGLIAVPGLYVWFNLAGAWDPYNSVNNLEVGIVNEDEGYKSEILPMNIELGNTIVSALHENQGFKWIFTDYDNAMNKLYDGTFYAVIVIPKDFSKELLSIISGKVENAKLIYYTSEKNNPIAPKIMGKGASAIQQNINNAFGQTVYSVLLKTLFNTFSSDNISDARSLGNNVQSILASSITSLNSFTEELNMTKNEVENLRDYIVRIKSEMPTTASSDVEYFHKVIAQIESEINLSKESLNNVSNILKELGIELEMLNATIDLINSVENSVNNCHNILNTAENAANSFNASIDSLINLLDSTISEFDNLSSVFNLINSDLSTIKDKVSVLSSSSSIDDIKSIIGNDSDTFASMIVTPVKLNRNVVFHMENNAASMSGFYISICVWVGSLILAALLEAELTKKRKSQFRNKNLKNWQIYLGRYVLFGAFSIAQVTFIVLGCIFFLKISIANPIYFIVTTWLVAFCYSLFIYTMLASFGSIGKALCVILLVLQIAATGGTFPIQLISEIFQVISPFLPTTYALRAINMCVAGYSGNDLYLCMLELCVSMIPVSLILGLVLRNPILKVNEKFKEKVKSANILAI